MRCHITNKSSPTEIYTADMFAGADACADPNLKLKLLPQRLVRASLLNQTLGLVSLVFCSLHATTDNLMLYQRRPLSSHHLPRM